MSAVPLPQTDLKETIIQAVATVSGGVAPPPKKNNEYRFYHCHLGHNGLNCKKVNGPEVMPTRNDSTLLFVKSYIPERFDNTVLKYKWIPNNVFIEKSA